VTVSGECASTEGMDCNVALQMQDQVQICTTPKIGKFTIFHSRLYSKSLLLNIQGRSKRPHIGEEKQYTVISGGGGGKGNLLH
jgi:hypothetical protein